MSSYKIAAAVVALGLAGTGIYAMISTFGWIGALAIYACGSLIQLCAYLESRKDTKCSLGA